MQDMDPETRWSPQQALQHPFLTGQRFTGPFQPLPVPHVRARQANQAAAADGLSMMASPYAGDPALYHSPVAAMLATSPEFHAQAHAAALAAVQVTYLHPIYCLNAILFNIWFAARVRCWDLIGWLQTLMKPSRSVFGVCLSLKLRFLGPNLHCPGRVSPLVLGLRAQSRMQCCLTANL